MSDDEEGNQLDLFEGDNDSPLCGSAKNERDSDGLQLLQPHPRASDLVAALRRRQGSGSRSREPNDGIATDLGQGAADLHLSR